jgi:ribosomal protein S18 acetylase RimI-like enzyme
MNKYFQLISRSINGNSVYLNTVNDVNLEKIRNWKNSERNYFFHKQEISKEQQLDWYQKYLLRDNDFIFVINYLNNDIGSIGIRKIKNEWDIYNVIIVDKNYSKMGLMRSGIEEIINFSQRIERLDITLKVLKINPAVSWYIKNNFKIIDEQDEFYSMKYGV